MTKSCESNNDPMKRLREIMRQLRDPESGCPWDQLQTFETIAPYTIEESYEVADAIDRGDLGELRHELGDLLFQVVFHAQMAEEQGAFGFEQVADAICQKMERRHPHVFSGAEMGSAEEQTKNWEQLKIDEASSESDDSVLAGISKGLPEWMRALKLQKRAATVGFDWPEAKPVLAKVGEELDELRADMDSGAGEEKLLEEFGDLLFAACNLARHLKLDPGRALRKANAKFERRFRALEASAASKSIDLKTSDLETLDALWEEVKITQVSD